MTANTDRPELPLDELVPSLVKRYKTTQEFRAQKRIMSISSVHPLVNSCERQGLRKVVNHFIGNLQHHEDLHGAYVNRNKYEWLDEWRQMHELLFKYVYRNRGEFRVKGHDVYFGNSGDEEIFGIPKGGNDVLAQLFPFADNISALLSSVDVENVDDVCRVLATVHYQFVRIHPFGDGNGRIARAITDQIAISLGYPPIIAGFPRTDLMEKQRYHAAIRGCVDDANYSTLASWIKFKLNATLEGIA